MKLSIACPDPLASSAIVDTRETKEGAAIAIAETNITVPNTSSGNGLVIISRD